MSIQNYNKMGTLGKNVKFEIKAVYYVPVAGCPETSPDRQGHKRLSV